jgi:hypothetical protein
LWTVAFGPGAMVATAGDDLAIRIWHPETTWPRSPGCRWTNLSASGRHPRNPGSPEDVIFVGELYAAVATAARRSAR